MSREYRELERRVDDLGDEWAQSAASRCWMLGVPLPKEPRTLETAISRGAETAIDHRQRLDEWASIIGSLKSKFSIFHASTVKSNADELAC